MCLHTPQHFNNPCAANGQCADGTQLGWPEVAYPVYLMADLAAGNRLDKYKSEDQARGTFARSSLLGVAVFVITVGTITGFVGFFQTWSAGSLIGSTLSIVCLANSGCTLGRCTFCLTAGRHPERPRQGWGGGARTLNPGRCGLRVEWVAAYSLQRRAISPSKSRSPFLRVRASSAEAPLRIQAHPTNCSLRHLSGFECWGFINHKRPAVVLWFRPCCSRKPPTSALYSSAQVPSTVP